LRLGGFLFSTPVLKEFPLEPPGQKRALLWVFAGAFALRLVAIPLCHGLGYTGDEREYIYLAQQVSQSGDFVDSNGERSTRSPLFPLMLSGVFAVAGEGLLLPHLLNCFFGALAVVLGYLLCLRLGGDSRTALVAALAMMLYPGLIVYSALLQTESLFILFFLAVFILSSRLLEQHSNMTSVMLGLVSGLAALTRAVFLGFLPVLLLSILWIGKKRDQRMLRPVLISLLTFCIVVLPWTIRNFLVHDTVVPISTWAGKSLLIGNNPYATGTWSVNPGFNTWLEEQMHMRGVADPSLLNEVQVSELSGTIAFNYIASHPIHALELAVKKLHMFWIYPVTHSDSYVPLQALAVSADFILLLGVALGLVAFSHERFNLILILGAILVFSLTHIVLHAEARYRLPLVPLLCIFFGIGLSSVLRKEGLAGMLSRGKAKIVFSGMVCVLMTVYGFTGWLFLTGKI